MNERILITFFESNGNFIDEVIIFAKKENPAHLDSIIKTHMKKYSIGEHSSVMIQYLGD